MDYDLLIRDARLIDGGGGPSRNGTLGVRGGLIATLDAPPAARAVCEVDGRGLALAPGFIDVHTHDDTQVIRAPQMLPKLSQGVTTVIVGNCGISASPVRLKGDPPDPMNLLGDAEAFRYPRFADYRAAVDAAQPAVNVAALVGHTALRNNHLDRLDRTADGAEIAAMRAELRDALEHGALGLSSGLAYASALAAGTDEVKALALELHAHGALYATHLRTEFDGIVGALDEAFAIGRHARAPVVVSHLKCAGAGNWGRSGEVLAHLERAAARQHVGCDCYPYAASSSTLDLKQVTADFTIVVTWSTPHPEMAGRTLAEIAGLWSMDLLSTARRLQPAGAVYHGMDEKDVRRILAHPLTMVGSDGLPEDPLPHPRLWGAFPRVLGHYSRDAGLFPLETAVHKMTGLSAQRFGLRGRGLLREGHRADLTLFDPATVRDVASFERPAQPAAGILGVWVNGVASYRNGAATGERAGRFLPREALSWENA
ncbi:N-acyl-D-amino-acid deacylase family protein [Chitiniphilus eburneus]|uniref:D-aminoacylase n=1 Tax=Chitiniphilus eburneus TaxID=2571148 RepID=A0A4U0PJV8_9NEIS|nr:D-aminoacylase [Chitiniphilus eburneus]TJZ68363.1 D-aminoacylase [Chitiniphilus eburneus]